VPTSRSDSEQAATTPQELIELTEAHTHWLHELTWPEIEEMVARTQIVLLPMGSTEQHGPHLPEGTDTFVPVHLAEGVARMTGVAIAPPLWFTTAEQHMGFGGTISLRPTTLIAVLRDVVGSLAHHGFRDFVLLNGHLGGAHPALLSAADEVQLDVPGAKIWDVDLNAIAVDELRGICESEFFPHAEELETAQMLAIRPDLVHLDRAVDSSPERTFHARLGPIGIPVQDRASAREFRAANPTGIIGQATMGTAEKGARALEAQTLAIAAFVRQLAGEHAERASS
jgi:creatinine amidohydrolase